MRGSGFLTGPGLIVFRQEPRPALSSNWSRSAQPLPTPFSSCQADQVIYDASALAEALGVLLAAYVFGFDLVRRRIDKMDELLEKGEGWEDIPGPFLAEARAAARRTGAFLPFAYELAVAPLVVVAVYIPVTVDILAGLDTTKPYDPARATVVLLVLAFVGLGVWQAKRVKRLRWLRKWYRGHADWARREFEESRQRLEEAVRKGRDQEAAEQSDGDS